MQQRRTTRAISITAITALIALGCASTPPEAPPAPVEEKEFVENVEVIEVVEEVVPELRTIYFDFNKAEIRSDARAVLKANAEIIMANRQLGSITLQGNTDERGSEEYNLALGERRAASVKQYLVDLGVPSSRLRTVSFGESKPAVMGHTESAWRWNRRTDFSSPR
jgi:peptidoglycan-associated lipoprotein